ncbi:hypothetical protein TBLA_0H00150 [Henningerozyma blattae CBS 6284]|uniref:Palmitoyltransferase n=1 Tax=Henningerozyma blattae (strain ATCC 34711 / CBS 6284 / DSM 70876 / NBRC 10599 / NRRL Y-10934 / UCD 77-7) TaxID=1071380 RepID=I2H7F6_HENB6|nr:hypothetical protein TBLA_0H00150 [Tetrapisispora blattae CBS 6284]CCH62308.1 hypothetical protein TBLA_0H00150 [Tetrapisispora blattae CBS 6284]
MYNSLSVTTVFPKLFTTFLYLWSFFTAIYQIKWINYTFMITMLWSLYLIGYYAYVQAFMVGPGSPSDFPELRVNSIEAAEAGTEFPPEYLSQKSITLKHDGRARVCRTCLVWKPDRCHHCSSCDRCILKMDHHCPWFAECIGFKNHKYFINFLIYNSLYATFVCLISSKELWNWFSQEKYVTELINIHLLLLFIVSLITSVSMTLFTAYSIYQVLINRTTIELYAYRRYKEELEILQDTTTTYNSQSNRPLPTDNVFDLGSYKLNWCETMGTTWKEWLLPVQTNKYIKSRHTSDEKGLYFNINRKVASQLQESAILQDRLLRRVTPRSSRDYSQLSQREDLVRTT